MRRAPAAILGALMIPALLSACADQGAGAATPQVQASTQDKTPAESDDTSEVAAQVNARTACSQMYTTWDTQMRIFYAEEPLAQDVYAAHSESGSAALAAARDAAARDPKWNDLPHVVADAVLASPLDDQTSEKFTAASTWCSAEGIG